MKPTFDITPFFSARDSERGVRVFIGGRGMKDFFVSILMLSIFLIISFYTSTSYGARYWAKIYGTSGAAASFQQTSDDGYIIVGSTGSDFWVVKLDSGGNLIWEKIYGGGNLDYAYSIQETRDGGYIIAGYTHSFGAGVSDIWILKLDINGDVTWQKTYGGERSDSARTIQQTSDGGYIVAGVSQSFSADGINNIWVLKLNRRGNVIWQNIYGITTLVSTQSIQQTSDGGYIVVVGGTGFDVLVLKLDSNGNVIWGKSYGGGSPGSAYSIQKTRGGGYIVAAGTRSIRTSKDIWILKLDINGDVTWQKTYGGERSDSARTIQQTSDGGYIIAGYTHSFGAYGINTIWVLKLNRRGNITWQKTYSGLSGFFTQETSAGDYIVLGDTYGIGYSNNSFEYDGIRTPYSNTTTTTIISYPYLLKLDSNGEIPDCEIIDVSNASISNTSFHGIDKNRTAQSTSATITETNIIPQNSSTEITTICEGDFELCLLEKIYGERSEGAELLRYIRDNMLSQTPVGREIIRLYYRWSPAIVKAMEANEEFKEDVEEMIDGLLEMIGGEVE